MMKKHFWVIQYLLGIVIFSILIARGRINLFPLKYIFTSPMILLLSLVALILSYLLVILRWKELLKYTNICKISLYESYQSIWIALALQFIAPSRVGDLGTFLYIKKRYSSIKSVTILSALTFDAVISFCGLLIIQLASTITRVVFTFKITSVFDILSISLSSIIVGFCVLARILLKTNLNPKLILAAKLRKFLKNLSISIILRWVGYSILSHFLRMIAIISLMVKVVDLGDNLIPLIYSLPLAFLGVNVSSSNGIGVGNLIFDELFYNYNLGNGASFFNLYILLMLAMLILGGVTLGGVRVFKSILVAKGNQNVRK